MMWDMQIFLYVILSSGEVLGCVCVCVCGVFRIEGACNGDVKE